MKRIIPYTIALYIALLLGGCNGDVIYDTNITLDPKQWSRADTLDFQFDINDESVKYDLFLKVRYSTQYKFYNLFVNTYLIDSTQTYRKDSLVDMILFNPKRGQPLGSGSSLFDIEIPFALNKKFNKKGTYNILTHHYMRDEIIDGIHYFGLKIKKSEPTE